MKDAYTPVSILGTDYKLRFLSSEEYPKLKECSADGLFEPYSKELIISTDMFSMPEAQQVENLKEYQNKVVRHELLHAFFHESGCLDYASDERLIDLLSIQIDKIFDALAMIPYTKQYENNKTITRYLERGLQKQEDVGDIPHCESCGVTFGYGHTEICELKTLLHKINKSNFETEVLNKAKKEK